MAVIASLAKQSHKEKTLYIVAPRGWCAGVERAIGIVDVALEHYPAPIYVRREIVHNKTVVDSYKKRGVIFIDELDQAPEASTVIFSAHGIAPGVALEAKARKLKVIDATCPLVTKVHLEVQRFVKQGYTVLYIGHRNHEEAVGVFGEAPNKIRVIETEEEARNFNSPDGKLVVLTQTTLSVDDTQKIVDILKKRFPELVWPSKDDICYATQNRQNAIKTLIKNYSIDFLYVIGSKNSSNSNRLCEVAEDLGVKARLIDNTSDIVAQDWQNASNLGLTAGASAPESLVQEVAGYFKERGYKTEEVIFQKEDVNFALPQELLELTAAK